MTSRDELPWVAVRDVAYMYGVGYQTAKNKIADGTFPVTTYKVGKTWVIDKHVHEGYFMKMRAAGLKSLA